MSVTIPTSYDTEDLTIGEGLESGQLIKPAALQTLAENHNFIGGNYRPTVGEVFYHSGFTTTYTSNDFYNLCGVSVFNEADGRGLMFSGVFANSESVDADVRLACGSNTGSSVTITAGATNQVVTLSCDTPAGSAFVATVQGNSNTELVYFGFPPDNETLKLLCGSFYWQEYTGTQSSAPSSSGFVWAQTGEFASTYPVNVEQVNRLLGGPLTAWKYKPQAIGGMHWGWTYRFPSTSSTTYQDLGKIVIHKRRNRSNIKIYVLGVNATVKATLPGTEETIATSVSNGPGKTASPSSITINVSDSIDLYGLPQTFVIDLQWKSTVGNAAEVMDVNVLLDKV